LLIHKYKTYLRSPLLVLLAVSFSSRVRLSLCTCLSRGLQFFFFCHYFFLFIVIPDLFSRVSRQNSSPIYDFLPLSCSGVFPLLDLTCMAWCMIRLETITKS
jgi:hypothetical protein